MATTPSKPGLQQDMEQLRKRYAELDRKKTVAETNLKNANDTLDQLKKQAREQFGTDDLEQLRARLDEMRRENERKRAEYQKHLEEIEAALNQVDQQFADGK